ncbi:putative protein kinase [Marasmius crinis-equi]|uniref:Protein-serine/threonine kinase n=1 Tax=Marasmius crinis-equi TaxID=585013 RepID=A0ABR3FGQ6_9AGAR
MPFRPSRGLGSLSKRKLALYPLNGSFWCRKESTALHFYQNKQLDLYASREAKRLTLRQLTFFGRSMDEERLVKSANYVRTELPVRIAHRIRDLQSLPYVVVTQEGVAKVYELYWTAFEKFRRYPPIKNMKDNEEFCRFLSTLLHEHSPVIPNLSLGLSLSSPYLPPDVLDSFMRRMLVSRISRRVLAEHHIALSDSFRGDHSRSGRRDVSEAHVGIIFTAIDVKRSIERCAQLLQVQPAEELETDSIPPPKVMIEGHTDTKFSYIRAHLEYIVFELLKNSMRATKLKHRGASSLPPLRATIAAGANDIGIRISDEGGGLHAIQRQYGIKSPSDLFSFSHTRNSARMETDRIGALRTASTRPQGIWGTVNEQIQAWEEFGSPDTAKDPEIGNHPRIGIGLPMSNIFAKKIDPTMISTDFDDSVPPPAYTEQEYDNKVTITLQASLADSQDEWEEWDEAKFQAAAAAHAGTGTSSSAPGGSRASSDVKKPLPSYPQDKKGSVSGPSAGVGSSSSYGGPVAESYSSTPATPNSSQNTNQANVAGAPSSSQIHHPLLSPSDISYGDEEDMSAPPPAFTGVGPSLDGPPYEEVVRMSYNSQEDYNAPRLPSPSWGPQREYIPPRPSSAATSIQSFHPEEDPRPRVEQHIYSPPQPHSLQPSYGRGVQPTVPRMNFNPSVAYGRAVVNEPDHDRNRKSATPVFDASAFYNSSVSSFMNAGNSHSSRPTSQHYSSSNPNSYGSRASPDPNRFTRNSNAFISAPVSPMPKYPIGQSFATANFSHQTSTNSGPGAREPRWAMSEQQFPFSR